MNAAAVGDTVKITKDEGGAELGAEVTVLSLDGTGIRYAFQGWELAASHDAYKVLP